MIDLTIIPARGNSKRVPGKNKKLLAGKPLVVYTIEAALKSKHTDVIYVTTEDEEIAQIVKGMADDAFVMYGKDLREYRRDPKLAMDHVQVSEVMLDVIRWHEFAFTSGRMGIDSCILSLAPTSPFRTAKHIDEAYEVHRDVNKNQGCTISAVKAPGYYWMNHKPLNHDPMRRWGTQDHWHPEHGFPMNYRENGSIYIFNGWKFSTDTVYRMPPYTIYESSDEDTIDVDTIEDWDAAVEILGK